jgi:hypothetical protein
MDRRASRFGIAILVTLVIMAGMATAAGADDDAGRVWGIGL